MQQQGTALSGIVLQGAQFQGLTLRGFRFATAKLNGSPLDNLRLVGGELIAEQNGITLHGTSLVECAAKAEARNDSVQPPQTVPVAYKITGIVPEDRVVFSRYRPPHLAAQQRRRGPTRPPTARGRRIAQPNHARLVRPAANPSISIPRPTIAPRWWKRSSRSAALCGARHKPRFSMIVSTSMRRCCTCTSRRLTSGRSRR